LRRLIGRFEKPSKGPTSAGSAPEQAFVAALQP